MQPPRDHFGEIFYLPHAHDGHDVGLAGHRVRFCYPCDTSHLFGQLGYTRRLGVDQDEGCHHLGTIWETVPPAGSAGANFQGVNGFNGSNGAHLASPEFYALRQPARSVRGRYLEDFGLVEAGLAKSL